MKSLSNHGTVWIVDRGKGNIEVNGIELVNAELSWGSTQNFVRIMGWKKEYHEGEDRWIEIRKSNFNIVVMKKSWMSGYEEHKR